MNGRTIKALLRKDLALFAGNRFYFVITVLSLFVVIIFYFIMPRTVDEKLKMGMYAPVLPPAFAQLANSGTDVTFFDSQTALQSSVLDGDFEVAIALPPDIMDVWATGGEPRITVYYASDAPPELYEAVVTLVNNFAYIQTGQTLPFELDQEVLGPDLLGAQISMRDHMRPLFAILIMLLEILTLAGLIAVEIEQGTARALLVTPMRTSDMFMSKGILGIGLVLGQSVFFMTVVGGFTREPLLILTTLVLGSFFIVSVAFLLASLVRNVNAVTGWGMLILLLFTIPSFGAIVPGLLADWAKIIPSYYLIDTVNRVANYGAGWGDVSANLLIMAAITAVVIFAGQAVLRRRFQ